MSTSDGGPGLVRGAGSAESTGASTVGPSGRYALGALLGRGGMADVYQAHDQVLERDVAVKLLRDRTPDPTERARFVAEAQTLARLNHPNLVTILDAGVSDERPFLVLELVVGSSLAVELAQTGQGHELSPERVSRIGAQIAAALAHCHAAGIVHRDVKPGNILLGAGDRALLTDFGISRLLDGSARDTQTGFTIGTAGYLAPEQVYGDEITPAVDVYALGLVLLEACTGRREYTGTPVEAAIARLHRSPRIPIAVPAALSGVLAELTQTDPTLRPGAAETAQALASGASATLQYDGPPSAATGPLDVSAATQQHAGFADAAALAAAGARAPVPGPESATSDRRRRRPVFTLAGWAVAAAVAVALALNLQGMSSDPVKPSTGSTSEPEKPATASAKPSPQMTPAADLAPPSATARPARVEPKASSPGGRRTSPPATTRAPAPVTQKKAEKPLTAVNRNSENKGRPVGKGKDKDK